ncbi:MAG: hydrolase [Rhodoglobus sp.]|nr:hydrolase [Rhodoglobus sp.]
MSDPPIAPRKSASLLVVRGDPPEVLLLERHAAATFPSMQVFPGGVVEAQDYDAVWKDWANSRTPLDRDERAVRIAGIRETWEEAGILVACGGPPPGTDRSRPFIDVVRAGGHPLALDDLYDFAHWITPEARPKRFDTRFFLVRAPEGQDASADGSELVACEWIGATQAVDEHVALMPPTHLNLLRLAESPTVEHAIAAAAARPRFTVLPVRERFAGGVGVRIPAEAGYGVTEHLLRQQP